MQIRKIFQETNKCTYLIKFFIEKFRKFQKFEIKEKDEVSSHLNYIECGVLIRHSTDKNMHA